jgi:hypothetical protein
MATVLRVAGASLLAGAAAGVGALKASISAAEMTPLSLRRFKRRWRASVAGASDRAFTSLALRTPFVTNRRNKGSVEVLVAATEARLVTVVSALVLSLALVLFAGAAAVSDANAPNGNTNTARSTAHIRVEMRIIFETLLTPTIFIDTDLLMFLAS